MQIKFVCTVYEDTRLAFQYFEHLPKIKDEHYYEFAHKFDKKICYVLLRKGEGEKAELEW